jgi:hypothetical protein
MDIK